MLDTATQNSASQKAQRGRRTNKRGRNGGPRSAPTPGAQAKTEGAPRANGAQAVEAASGEDPKDAEIDDSLICWICAEPVKYYSVSECNHRTCHVCALRLRALYKKLDCTFCKVRRKNILLFIESTERCSIGIPAIGDLHSIGGPAIFILFAHRHSSQGLQAEHFLRDSRDDGGNLGPPPFQLSRVHL